MADTCSLADIRRVAQKLKDHAIEPHPATAAECEAHNALVTARGRPDLCIEPGEMVYRLLDGKVY